MVNMFSYLTAKMPVNHFWSTVLHLSIRVLEFVREQSGY